MAGLPPERRMAVAVRYLAAGFYRDGFGLHEARREIPHYPEHALPMPAPAWDASQPLAGRRLLLWHEQGLGDMIQMLRFVPLLVQRGAEIVLAVQPPLKRLAIGLPGVTSVIAPGDSFADVDFHCPLMSLPHLLAVRLATVPARMPYLRLPAGLAETWRARLGPKLRPRVGLVLSGAPGNTLDRWRSVPAQALAPLLARRDVEFHVLQSEIRPADRDYFAGLPHVRTHEAALTDLSETGALAMQMDRIVTVCTAMAHLSGALALPGWVLLSTRGHWLWLTGRTESPWYPSLRLFRQQVEDDWRPIVQQVATLLG